MARSEQEIVGGYFLVQIAGGEVALPELPYGEARVWARASAAAFGPVFAQFETVVKPGDMVPVEAANETAMDAVVDQILAYDRTGVLGGRAVLCDRDHGLSTSRIFALYRLLYEETHPFAADLQTALMQMAMARVNAQLAQSAGASSTNGPSDTGGTDPPTSMPGSRRRNSPSSGNGGSSAKPAIRGINSASFTPPSAMPSPQRTSQRASGR